MPPLKLTVVTRQDLSAGYQIVQSAHAVANFAHDFPEIFSKWKQTSNSIICLSTKNEFELSQLALKFEKEGVKISKFYEPDISNQLTLRSRN